MPLWKKCKIWLRYPTRLNGPTLVGGMQCGLKVRQIDQAMPSPKMPMQLNAQIAYYALRVSQQLVGIGLDNIIAVSMPDAVLVADKQRAQDVKKVVELLKSKDVMQAKFFQRTIGRGESLKAWFWEIASRLNVYT